jgi:hypothetical protein
MTLEDIFLGRISDTNIALPLDPDPRMSPNAVGKIRSKKGSLGLRQDLLMRVNAYVDQCGLSNPPSLREVASHVKASVGGLQNALPERAREIVRRHNTARVERLNRARKDVADAVARAVSGWDQHSNEPISRKAVMRHVHAEGAWAKNVVRSAVKQIFEERALAR